MRVAQTRFRGRRDLVCCGSIPSPFGPRWPREPRGGDELFPTHYGELDLGAVTGIEPLILAPTASSSRRRLLVPARGTGDAAFAH